MNDEILEEYKDFVWGNHPKRNTRLTYTDHPRVFLREIGKPLDEITDKDINDWVKKKHKTHSHNGNAIRFWSIRKFLKWAKKDNLEKLIPKVNPVDAGKQALDEKNLDKLMSTVEMLSPLHRLVIYLEIDCLRRPSEIRNLKKKDRYGNKLTYKGKTGIKTCTLSQRCIKAWDDYQKIRPIAQTSEDDEYLILSDYGQYKGKRLQSPNAIDRIVKETCLYAKIEIPQGERATNYLIKRTGVTWQLQYGNDPKIVQYQAGHTKPETTMKYDRPSNENINAQLTNWEHKSANIKHKDGLSSNKSF